MSKKCHKCNTENQDTALFCKECGTPFEMVCPHCKKVCDNDIKSCDDCGTPLYPPKKVNTALFTIVSIIAVIILIVALFPTMRCCLSRRGFTQGEAEHWKYTSNYGVIKQGDSVTDYDGNTYKTVIIRERVWMAENMRAIHDNKGNLIALGGKEYKDDEPLRYYPNNDSSNVEKYGYLYNLKAVENICPYGWHIPCDFPEKSHDPRCAKSVASNSDWELKTYGYREYGSYSIGYNLTANNATGFSALPAGFVEYQYDGFYSDGFGYTATFWGADALHAGLTPADEGFEYHSSNIDIFMLDGCAPYIKRLSLEISETFNWIKGCSVRCVRDEPAR